MLERHALKKYQNYLIVHFSLEHLNNVSPFQSITDLAAYFQHKKVLEVEPQEEFNNKK